MLKILSVKQMRALDAHTIQHEPIASIDLMERACKSFVQWFVQRVDATKKIAIVCGTGNNGGDGLGIARMLLDWYYPVRVWVVRGLVPESEDFKINFERLKNKVQITDIKSQPHSSIFEGCDVIIDAIFGSGLSRPADGIYAQTISAINKADALRIAVDIPSGLLADASSSGEILQARCTITFQLPKLAFFLPQSFQYTGDWCVVDIGLSKEFVRNSDCSFFQTTEKDARRILKPRKKFDHKGVFGHALVVAGSYGKMGAAVLASKATLRSGAGLVTTHIPKCGYEIIQTSLPDAMVSIDTNENFFTGIADPEKFNAIGIGPGLGQDPATVKALAALLKKFRKPVVIDADALNMVAAHQELLEYIPENSILTPHPKEFERLVGKSADDFERLEKLKNLSGRLKSVVVLKGAYTAIAMPQGPVYFNPTGNPGMAKGGSGDVLTGVLTALLAQQYTSQDSGILGVFLHGRAGDLGTVEKGSYGLTASDLVEFLPQAFKTVII
jgi:ADP-dependent NAD(P)H-hydrate dehydratase / NAD(P)H-hydrate epimerase